MEPGQQISPNLRLVRLLGKGGMGAVWVADHLTLGTQVAVKVMSRAVAAEAELVERFRREASAAAQLKSPHVAQVFDHGVTASGEPFIVMELLDGEDLSKRVDREGPLPLPLVAEIVSQAAKALTRAHAAGVIHRDIKAENVFLCEHDGELLVKVLDFGIAKMTGDASVSVTSTRGTFGTPLYMSPEQLLSAKNVDARADLWSLGVVAYLLLTQRFPFEGDTLGAVSVAVHGGRFVPPSRHRPALPAEVDTWFLRALHPAPAERFASAKELAETLRAALAAPGQVVIATTANGEAERAQLGHLKTMDSRGSAEPVPTLSGASLAPAVAPSGRRTIALAAAGLAIGAIVAMLALRGGETSPDASARDVPVPEKVSTTTGSTTSPAPEVVPTGTSAEPMEPKAPATSPAAPVTARAVAPGSAASNAGVRPTSTGVHPIPKPIPTKDDIGF